MKFFRMRCERLGGARRITRYLGQSLLRQLFRGNHQVVFHLLVGGIEIECIARISNQYQLALWSTCPENLPGDKLFELLALYMEEGELPAPPVVATARHRNRLPLARL